MRIQKCYNDFSGLENISIESSQNQAIGTLVDKLHTPLLYLFYFTYYK